MEGIEEDNARAIVKLTLTKESITISQYAITVVSKKEFEKNSKVLSMYFESGISAQNIYFKHIWSFIQNKFLG